MINVDSVSKYFGLFKAVDNINFTVKKGDVLAFLGPNGAGKSTTIKMMTGLLKPTYGNITINDTNVFMHRLKVQAMMGYVPQTLILDDHLTPYQFLDFISSVRGLWGRKKKQAIDKVIEQTNIGSVMHRKNHLLPRGFQRRVCLAQALLHDPPLIIMDEPSNSLDPNQDSEVRKLILSMMPHKAIVISTHVLDEIDNLCTRVIVIHEGKIVEDTTPLLLKARSLYKNAIGLVLPVSVAKEAAVILKQVPDVQTITVKQKGDSIAFTIFPKKQDKADVSLMEIIVAICKRYAWPIQSLFSEDGRMIDVFRYMTGQPISIEEE